MRILILHMRYWPDATGTGPLVTELAEDLASMGDDVAVVTSAPHYGRSEIPAEYRGRVLHRSVREGVRLYRTFAPVSHVSNPLVRAFDYSVYSLSSALAGIGLGRQDVVLSVAPPITVGFSGWLASLAAGAPMIFNAQDIWPDGLVALGGVRAPVLIGLMKFIERLVYRMSRRITVVSDGMKANLQAKGVPPETVAVIPNWVDTKLIQPRPKSESLAEEIGIGDRFVVLFAGNIGYAAGLDSVVGAAELLQADERIRFMFVGEGSAKAGLQRQVRERGLANVVFLPTQPAARLSRVLASADLSLVTLKKNMGTLSVPSKSYAFMASGRAILSAVPADSEIRRLLSEADCGLSIPPEEPEELASAIRALAEDAERLKVYGRNGRSFVERHYSRSEMTARYRQLFLEETGRRAPGAAWS